MGTVIGGDTMQGTGNTQQDGAGNALPTVIYDSKGQPLYNTGQMYEYLYKPDDHVEPADGFDGGTKDDSYTS